MEDKLDMVKKMMELEKEKRSSQKKSSQGTIWRSATNQKQINGYSQMVLQKHKEAQPNLPPTSNVLRTESQQKKREQAAAKDQLSQQEAVNQSQTASNQEQQEENQEVKQFLSSISLDKYQAMFIENGIEDLEIILELDEVHLEQMKVPLGHKLKILKRIKEIRKDKGMTVPESRQGQRQHINSND